MTKISTLTALAALFAATPAVAATYKIDPAHSSVSFTIKHLGVSKVHGSFSVLSGSVDYEAGKAKSWKAEAELDPASVDTRIGARDKHLKNPDYLDVEKCPKMSFKSTKVEGGKSGNTLHGELTLHCVTKPVALALEITEGKDPKGNAIIGASATGKLKRSDWAVGAASPMLGDDIALQIDIEAKAEPK